jgi:hypothetical protein
VASLFHQTDFVMLAVVVVAVVTKISELSWIQRLTPLLRVEKVQIQSRVLEGNGTVIFVETVFLLWRVSTSAFILLTFGLNVMMGLKPITELRSPLVLLFLLLPASSLLRRNDPF